MCGEALALAGLAADVVAGRAAAASALSGTAAERFARMARGLGGPADLLERHQIHLPVAPLVRQSTPRAPAMSAPSMPAAWAWRWSSSAVAGAMRPSPSTMPSGSPRSAPSATKLAPTGHWRWYTPATRPGWQPP